MPSPDVRKYVDLTIQDLDAQAIFEQALADAQAKFPDWVPREGNTEVVLGEALSLEVSHLNFAINRLPGTLMEILLRLYGLERSQGVRATATAAFTLSDADGHTIEEGTTLVLSANMETPLVFRTDANLAVNVGSSTGTVAITAELPGATANGTPAGTPLDLLEAILHVEHVELAGDVVGGEGPEAGEDFLNRGAQILSRLVTTLVLPEHFTAAVLEEPDVYRAMTVDNYDPGQAGDPGDHGGHVTVAVLGEGGVALSSSRKTELEATLEAKALANLDVHVVDPTITVVAVAVTAHRLPGYTDVQVKENVVAALNAYLNPDTWPWSGTVRRFELVALVDRAEGVDYVEALTTPAADTALTGVAPLADANVVVGNVTVTS